ncbi:MAG TPA: MFS transporter [Vicinamibacterales bacterium]|nr:MFS transporter [Vicinamibacterales bacterium]
MPSLDAYAALRNPIVRRYAGGRFGAVLGLQMLSVSVGWHLYERTSSAWALGLVGAVEVLPVFLLMPVTGTAADRLPRVRVAAAAHTAIAVATLGLAYLAAGGAGVSTFYLLLGIIGAARAFAMPAVQTILPRLLTPTEFANANAWVASTFQLAAVTGPALAGALIGLTGAASTALTVAAAGQLLFVSQLLRLPEVRPLPTGQRTGWRSAFDGFRFVRRTPIYLAAITLDLFAVLLGGATALLPIFAKDVLHVGPVGLGWLRAAPAVGAMLTALLQTRLRPWQRPGRVLLMAVAGYGVATIGLGLSRDFGVSLACLFATGVCDSISVVIRLTLEQIITPDELRGRVSAIKSVFVGFSNEFGAFESGATAALFGPVASVVGGGLGVIAVVAGIRRAWPELWRLGPLHTLRPD